MKFFKYLLCQFIYQTHQVALPPGPPDTTQVDVTKLSCERCGKDFLEAISEIQGTSREQALRQFTDPILHPPKVDKSETIGYKAPEPVVDATRSTKFVRQHKRMW